MQSIHSNQLSVMDNIVQLFSNKIKEIEEKHEKHWFALLIQSLNKDEEYARNKITSKFFNKYPKNTTSIVSSIPRNITQYNYAIVLPNTIEIEIELYKKIFDANPSCYSTHPQTQKYIVQTFIGDNIYILALLYYCFEHKMIPQSVCCTNPTNMIYGCKNDDYYLTHGNKLFDNYCLRKIDFYCCGRSGHTNAYTTSFLCVLLKR